MLISFSELKLNELKENHMKRFVILLAIGLMSVMASYAQPRGPRCGDDGWRERMRTERIAYLSTEMDLTSAEAEKFWPVYNGVQDRKRDAQRTVLQTYKALEEASESGKPEAELSAALDAYLSAIETRHTIESGAVDEFLAVLPAEKVAKLYVAEEKFRRQQIHRLHPRP